VEPRPHRRRFEGAGIHGGRPAATGSAAGLASVAVGDFRRSKLVGSNSREGKAQKCGSLVARLRWPCAVRGCQCAMRGKSDALRVAPRCTIDGRVPVGRSRARSAFCEPRGLTA